MVHSKKKKRKKERKKVNQNGFKFWGIKHGNIKVVDSVIKSNRWLDLL